MKHSLKLLAAAGLIALSTLASAQSTTPAAAPAAATSPAKKALIDKLLVIQQPGLELLARQLVQNPLGPLMQSLGNALQQVPADKREATSKALKADIEKFADESVVTLKASAIKLAPSTIGTLLDERFTEDELRTILAWFESSAFKKFNTVQPDLQKALIEKVMAENGTALDAKFKTLQQNLGKTLQTAVGQSAQQPSAAKPAPAASKAAPAKK